MIGGLDKATRGAVLYHDQDLCKLTGRELTDYRRVHIGFVFQFSNLVSSLTAREYVAPVANIAPDSMVPFAALARVVAKGLHILLCDEPTEAFSLIEHGVVISC